MKIPIFNLALESAAKEFLIGLPPKARAKILYVVDRVRNGELDAELFKKLENSEIWEFRILYGSISYRLFAFWDKEDEILVIATHGIIKKTRKTPSKEIAKAEAIRKQYFEKKHKQR